MTNHSIAHLSVPLSSISAPTNSGGMHDHAHPDVTGARARARQANLLRAGVAVVAIILFLYVYRRAWIAFGDPLLAFCVPTLAAIFAIAHLTPRDRMGAPR